MNIEICEFHWVARGAPAAAPSTHRCKYRPIPRVFCYIDVDFNGTIPGARQREALALLLGTRLVVTFSGPGNRIRADF